MMTRALATTFLLLTGLSMALAFARPAEPARVRPASEGFFDAHYELIFFAVLEGLYRDGVSDEVVASLTAPDASGEYPALFVWTCPICMPSYNAFLAYGARPGFTGVKPNRRTLGDGLPPEVKARCLDPSRDVRFEVLYELVEGWVEDRLAAMRLTEEEREVWSRGFEERRKKGMATLEEMRGEGRYEGLKSCALCDGANDAFRR